eukprot:378371_1
MASRQPLLPDWWGTKHTTILSTVGGALVIVGIIAAVHFSNTWSDVAVGNFLTEEFENGRFTKSVESLIVKLKANAVIPCAIAKDHGNRDYQLQYVSTNIITMEKVDLQFASTQTLTPAKFLGITTGRWNPLQLMKCDVVTKKPGDDVYVGQVDKEGANHGVGNATWGDTGGRYIGQWDHGAPDGIGENVYHNGDAYLGQLTAGNRYGEGKYTVNATGKSYSGQWVGDKMKGMVTITSNDGTSQHACSDIVIPQEFYCVA